MGAKRSLECRPCGIRCTWLQAVMSRGLRGACPAGALLLPFSLLALQMSCGRRRGAAPCPEPLPEGLQSRRLCVGARSEAGPCAGPGAAGGRLRAAPALDLALPLGNYGI